MIRGIRNVSGVSCHLASALQILCHTLVPLRDSLIQLYRSYNDSGNDSGNLAIELGFLLNELSRQDDDTPIDPSRFYSLFEEQCSSNDLGDTTTALTKLLQSIRSLFHATDSILSTDDQKKLLRKIYCKSLTGTMDQFVVGRKNVHISRIDGTHGDCNTLSDIRILKRVKRKLRPMPCPYSIDGSHESLTIAILATLEPSSIEGYNWDAAKGYEEEFETTERQEKEETDCGWRTEKRTTFRSLPNKMILHLQRFLFHNGQLEPLENPKIDISSVIYMFCSRGEAASEACFRYELLGGILHTIDHDEEDEPSEGGHVAAVIRRSNRHEDVEWSMVDDAEVTNLSETAVLDMLAGRKNGADVRGTLLVYSRVDATEVIKVAALVTAFQELVQESPPIVSKMSKRQNSPRDLVGRRLRIRWAKGKYYAGRVVQYDGATGKHRVEYDDGDVRDYQLDKKIVEWES